MYIDVSSSGFRFQWKYPAPPISPGEPFRDPSCQPDGAVEGEKSQNIEYLNSAKLLDSQLPGTLVKFLFKF